MQNVELLASGTLLHAQPPELSEPNDAAYPDSKCAEGLETSLKFMQKQVQSILDPASKHGWETRLPVIVINW